MNTYIVKYKIKYFWHTLKKVKGDGIMENDNNRFFILDDETRIEIPCRNTIFKFSKDRFYLIKDRAEAETGQNLKIVPK